MIGAAAPVAALTPEFPAPAQTTHRSVEAQGSHPLATGPFANGVVPAIEVEGQVTRTAWRVDAPGLTTLELLAPLRTQLLADGYDVRFECETARCGGYDFRYGTDLLPEPLMHVDLGDFRYLSAHRTGADGMEHLALMVSRSSSTGFVQLTEVGPATAEKGAAADALAILQPGATDLKDSPAPDTTGAMPASDVAARLERGGAMPLEDLRFASGAGVLVAGDYASLAALADWLRGDPARRLRLVGHSDASGGQAANVALSRARAEAARAALVALPGVDASQVEADGVGPLAPRASNLTPEGQTLNRRVEAMRID